MPPKLSDPVRVDCAACDARMRAPLPEGTERTEFAPDGIVRVTCGSCGEEVTVGFQRTDE